MPVGSRVAVDILAKASWFYRLNSTHTQKTRPRVQFGGAVRPSWTMWKRERERGKTYTSRGGKKNREKRAINRLLLHKKTKKKKKKKGRESIATSPSKGSCLNGMHEGYTVMLDSLAAVGTLEQLGANQSAITAEQMFLFFLSRLFIYFSFSPRASLHLFGWHFSSLIHFSSFLPLPL